MCQWHWSDLFLFYFSETTIYSKPGNVWDAHLDHKKVFWTFYSTESDFREPIKMKYGNGNVPFKSLFSFLIKQLPQYKAETLSLVNTFPEFLLHVFIFDQSLFPERKSRLLKHQSKRQNLCSFSLFFPLVTHKKYIQVQRSSYIGLPGKSYFIVLIKLHFSLYRINKVL